MIRLGSLFKYHDRALLVTVFLLCVTGTVMLYSASSIWAMSHNLGNTYFLQKQLVRLLAGILLMFGLMFLDYQILRKAAIPLMIGSVVLLLVTKLFYVFQHNPSPARWLYLGPLSLQTSDIARLSLIIYLAHYLSRKRDQIRDFYFGYLPPVTLLAVLLGLIIIQPDFSTAAILGLLGFALLFLGGARLPHLAATAAAALTVLVPVMLMEPYRRARVIAFLNLTPDNTGMSYQSTQSLISLGNGGLFGMGLGNSMEKNLFLPTPHTDFIFAIIGEEIGLIGALIILTLFLILFQRGLKIARESRDLFGMLLALGIALNFIIYAFINAAVVTSLLPTTGLPMPFISYGGSGLVTNLAGIGILLGIGRGKNAKNYNPWKVLIRG